MRWQSQTGPCGVAFLLPMAMLMASTSLAQTDSVQPLRVGIIGLDTSHVVVLPEFSMTTPTQSTFLEFVWLPPSKEKPGCRGQQDPCRHVHSGIARQVEHQDC